ncbi:hypothetical protein RQL62_17870 [Citrobacter amalonaticus]|nr:hypothetical protein [Citrobacter amalonaticus]
MDSNISELVKLGHERADEFKAACGAVDVRSVAQLISDLASQLEVQYVRAEESRREFRSADITMQNLEAQLKQSKIDADCYKKGMEASNARLVQIAGELSAIDAIHNDAVFITDDHYEQCPPGVQKIVGALAVLQIPAYQAFLAEVRARAIELAASERWGSGYVFDELNEFAAQLRKGVQS